MAQSSTKKRNGAARARSQKGGNGQTKRTVVLTEWVRTKQRHDGKAATSPSDETDAEDGEPVFRAPSVAGILTEEAGKAGFKAAAKDERDIGRSGDKGGKDLTPSTATSYFLTVLVPQYKEKMPRRTSREPRSTAKALDSGNTDRAGCARPEVQGLGNTSSSFQPKEPFSRTTAS